MPHDLNGCVNDWLFVVLEGVAMGAVSGKGEGFGWGNLGTHVLQVFVGGGECVREFELRAIYDAGE